MLSEFSRHGIGSRIGVKRADLAHLPLDPIIVAGPWLVAGGAVYAAVKTHVRHQ